MLTDFQHPFTDGFTSKYATKSSLTIPPHLKHVATLPCEISFSKNCGAQELSEASYHARLSHSKQLLKNSCTVMLVLFSSLTKDTQIGHTKNPTVWLYASTATQKKRYCGKMFFHTKSGWWVTNSAFQSGSLIWSNQIYIYIYLY